MRNADIIRNKKHLDDLFDKIDNISPDPEMMSHWAKYLCVLVSGFIETSVTSIFTEYTRDKSNDYISAFINSNLKRFTNPYMGKIIELAHSFNPQWATNLQIESEGEQKDAIDSIVANRNRIAHGKSVGITYIRIKEYYKSALKVIEFIDNQCNR